MAEPVPQRPQLAVSAAIFRDNQCLIVQRARAPGNGLWSFPGGRVEFGESLHTALTREVMEETGLTIEVLGLSAWRESLPTSSTSGGGHYLIMSFAARWIAGEPQLNDELQAFRWIDAGIPPDLKTTLGLADVLTSARALLAAA